MNEAMATKMKQDIEAIDDPALELKGKKNPLFLLDRETAPIEIVKTVVEKVQESVQHYEEVAKELEAAEPKAMAKLRELNSEGRYFQEIPPEEPSKDHPPENDDEEDDYGAEKEEEIKKMISVLMPHVEAQKKNLVEDVCEHFQTTDHQKRYEKIYEKIKLSRKGETGEASTVKAKSFDSPAERLLAPMFTPREKPQRKEEVPVAIEENGKEAEEGKNQVTELRKAAQFSQKKLKGLVVPKSEWAATAFNDPKTVPLDDPQREIRGEGLAQGGVCVDPGIKSAARLREKANAQCQNGEAPDYNQVKDVCRVGLSFETVDALLNCVEALGKKADICWIDNKFQSPSALGYQDVIVGIRIVMPGEKSHISEVQLSLDTMLKAKMQFGNAQYEKMQSSLADLHIPAHMHDSLLRYAIEMLDKVEGHG